MTMTNKLMGIINGGEPTSMLSRLNDEERRSLDAWATQQPAEPNGSVDLRKWPGWLDAFVRRTSSSDKASPTEIRKS
ncbi:hypothetical protein CFB84_43160 [Burkholderia aenigmatica]|uniref:Uncharacterized protein n=2 Tax=Burkholderia aenigmatica TaxID=2015348 RepID=A0A228HM53_9BURK|nr:hypothetical protein CFB84_43160 [Burkholderia aenigmatica]